MIVLLAGQNIAKVFLLHTFLNKSIFSYSRLSDEDFFYEIEESFLDFLTFFRKWSKDTHDFFLKLWQNGDALEAGVCLLPVVQMTIESGGVQVPWRNIVFGCTDLDAKAIERYGKEHKLNYK